MAVAFGSARWLPLHLFLAGGVVLAISGVSLMLTVTWSAAPAPLDRWVAVQRGSVALGAAGIAAGRAGDLPAAVLVIAGLLYITGLGVLVVLLAATIRRGVERRFDVAVAAYIAAVLAGIVGAVLGVVMVTTTPSPSLRAAHVAINLLGLVGLAVGGTMPFFAATVGRSRMRRHATPTRLGITLAWQVCMLALGASALAIDARPLAAIGLAGYSLGILIVLGWLPRPTGRQLRWAGPRLIALWAGGAWWAIAVAATAIGVANGNAVFAEHWLFVLVIAGYAQILWGSLAYLLPMLRGGGHERLGEGFATTRSWVGLIASNLAGLAMAGSWAAGVAVAVTVWALDSAWRAARLRTAGADQPTKE